MGQYKALVNTTQEAIISSYQIAQIIEQEAQKVLGLGGSNRWVENNRIMERDYRFGKEEVREATEEEKQKFLAFQLVRKHFESLK
ncbi:hypothetical protein V1503_19540 [Bacillus sp. SCS-151]|uniref:hypothetical protein n=1 Tax=Nanhaiella sioensis TaxID=3115293 RepID=UPI00397A38C9